MATSAPSLANRKAVARPIPREPPVTSATLPSNAAAISVTPIKMRALRPLTGPPVFHLELKPAFIVKQPFQKYNTRVSTFR